MKQKEIAYEPPKARIYHFDNNDRILTASGTGGETPDPTPDPTADYAARALTQLMGGTNTTIE